MKTTPLRTGIAALALLVGSVLFVSCSTLKRVDAPKFLQLAGTIQEVHSVRDMQLIGTSGSRVYLQYWHKQAFLGDEIVVYWTEINELPPDIVSELRAGGNPWDREQRKP